MKTIRLGLITLAIVSILLLIFIPVLTVKAQDVCNTSGPECYYTDIKISEGDSLVKIAREYNTSDSMTNSAYITELKRINGLNSDTIHAGCYLTVVCYR